MKTKFNIKISAFIILLITVCSIRADYSFAQSSAVQWSLHRNSNVGGRTRDHRTVTLNEKLQLYNTKPKEYVSYKEREFGINLDWFSSPKKTITISSKRGGNVLHYGDTIAIKIDAGGYLVYEKRGEGSKANLGWSNAIKYEWVVDGGSASEELRLFDSKFSLYNLKTKEHLVYKTMSYGINLSVGNESTQPNTNCVGVTSIVCFDSIQSTLSSSSKKVLTGFEYKPSCVQGGDICCNSFKVHDINSCPVGSKITIANLPTGSFIIPDGWAIQGDTQDATSGCKVCNSTNSKEKYKTVTIKRVN